MYLLLYLVSKIFSELGTKNDFYLIRIPAAYTFGYISQIFVKLNSERTQ